MFDRLLERLADAVQDDWRDKMQEHLPPEYITLYEDNAKVAVEGEAIVCTLTKKVPNFIEHGLGPRMGESGSYDLRVNNLKNGKMQQVIQVEPGKWRTMSWKGKPWVHPGFRRQQLLTKVAADVPEILARTIQGQR